MYWMGKSRKEVLHSKLTTSSILQQFSIKWEKKRGAFQAQCAGELLVGTLFEKYQKKSLIFFASKLKITGDINKSLFIK